MLLDTVPEPEFDRITALAAKLFDVPIALVSLVDADRQWFKSCIGLDATQTDRDLAFCAHALFDVQPLVVSDALEDVRFAYNPFVTGEPFIRFYAGAPLMTREGFALGTLCIIDRKPRQLTPQQLETLTALSQVVVDLVEARLGFRSREMFEKVAELSPNVMYLFDLVDKKNVFANRRFVDLIGYSPADDGSKLVERIFHPDDAQNSELHFKRMLTLKDGEVARLRFRVKAANGDYRVFEASETVFERDANGIPRKTLGIANDVTDLKRVQDEANAKTRLLETVLRNAGEGIMAVDRTGRVTVSNKAAHEILGVGDAIKTPEERSAAYGVFDLDGETEIPQAELPLGRALRGEVTEGKEVILRTRARPSSRYLIATGRPMIDDRGASIGGVITFRDVTSLKKAQHALAELAVTDDLTALPNKRALRERLSMLAREGGRGRKFAVVITDVDHFKKVNDTFGHKTGDEVLAAVGRTLRECVRSTDFVARYGGEEFVVLYTDVDERVAATLAEKLRAAIAAIEEPAKVTASFGVCANTGDFVSDGEGLIKAADSALYRAKRAGRDRVVRHHQPVSED
jgi:diguanylate cyclase (GGDEF)-like protein/PAS domain S-box-containing protein